MENFYSTQNPHFDTFLKYLCVIKMFTVISFFSLIFRRKADFHDHLGYHQLEKEHGDSRIAK